MATENFQHILRVLNTNVEGQQKIMYALTAIKGVGRRFSNLVCKKAEIDMNKRFVFVPYQQLLWVLPSCVRETLSTARNWTKAGVELLIQDQLCYRSSCRTSSL